MEEIKKRKTTTSTQVKSRYNAKAYTDHKFRTKKGSELDGRVMEYKAQGNSLNALIEKLLEDYFKENN